MPLVFGNTKHALPGGRKTKTFVLPEHVNIEGNVSAGGGGAVDQRLDDGNLVLASEFFDEDDPAFDYRLGEPVKVSWVDGWEWLLPMDEEADAIQA